MDNHATDGARFAGCSGSNRDADALHRLALDEYRRGNLAGAVGMLEKAAELLPGDAAVRCDLGAALGAMGRHSEAVGQFQAAVMLRHSTHGNKRGQDQEGDFHFFVPEGRAAENLNHVNS